MAIPSPQERPDLYDGYDGLPDDHKTTVTASQRLQRLIEQRQAMPNEEPKNEEIS